MVAAAIVAVGVPLLSQQVPSSVGESVYKKVSEAVVLLVVTDENHQDIAQGSGFIVEGGRIVTNAHVVRGGTVFVKSGVFRVTCALEKIDAEADLALLKPATELATGHLALSDTEAGSGSRVFAIGNPRGMEKTITEGLVTGIRTVEGRELLQISAAISPGSSGGPVVNDSGAVVGIAVAGLSNAQNLNFAVPLRKLKALLAENASVTFRSLIDEAAKTADLRKALRFSLEDDSDWNKAWIKERDLYRTALHTTSLAAELVELAEVARDLDAETAIDSANRAIAISKTARALAALARAYQTKASLLPSTDKTSKDAILQKAVEAARGALTLSATPQNEYLLADIEEDAAHFESSLVHFQRAYAVRLPDVERWSALRGMIRVARQLNKSENAAEWFATLARNGAATDFDIEQQATFLEDNHQYATAAPLREQIAKKPNQRSFTDSVKLWQSAAYDRYVIDDYDAALYDARECVAAGATVKNSEETVAVCHNIVAHVLQQRGVYDQAIASAREAISLNGELYGAYTVLSQSLESLERFSEAEAAAKSALRISDGKDASAHFALGSAYFGQKKWGLAKQAFENAARLNPKDSNAAFNVAVSLYNDRFYTEAISWYEEALRRNPSRKDRAEILGTIQRLRDR